jgi:hypothetical protein
LLKAKHIPGTRKEIYDALSRFQATKFRKLAPEADLCPVVTTITLEYLQRTAIGLVQNSLAFKTVKII